MIARLAVSLLLLFSLASLAQGAGPRALPEGKRPSDARLDGLRHLDSYFPFVPPKTADEWESRAARLRRQILVSQGLWPLPTKTPLNAVVHGKQDFGDYTIEKVYFEAMPGYYVTGSLYRPLGSSDDSVKRSGVLRPHGHWPNGRFHDKGLDEVRKEIAASGEKFEEGGRSPLQAMNVQLARMGCVVFHYDMIGYADSQQIPFDVAHGFRKQRPDMNREENWGLFSPQAEAHLQSVMGLQTWSSIRALDFLASLDDVDPKRIGVTGASGGGTQTFMLCAIDPRPAAAVPAVMVSTAMQGGCTCENASCLRVHAGNVDFAALFAPKPLHLTAANDWTVEMPTKGFPELQEHYTLLGAKDRVALTPLLQFGHNYNHPSRAAMYAWFNEHLGLGQENIEERDYKRLTAAELTVFNDEHPRPEGGPQLERDLLRHWHEDAQKQLAEATPKDKQSLAKYREVAGGALESIINRPLPAPSEIEYEAVDKTDRGGYLEIVGLVRNLKHREELPMTFLYPKEDWNKQVVIWVDDEGKSSLFAASGELKPAVKKLVDAGAAVAAVDLFLQGEFLTEGEKVEQNRIVENGREFAGYTYGYNPSLFAQRVHDLLTAIVFCTNHQLKPEKVDVVGFSPQAGPIVAVARSQADDLVRRAAIDTHSFRFGKLTDYRDPNFLPGGAKYGDLPGILALSAPHATWVAGEGEGRELPQAAFKAAGSEGKLTFDAAEAQGRADRAAAWLLAE
jgi:dienelactone hydrolase